jgi:serine/threonine-protein kinase RsbT
MSRLAAPTGPAAPAVAADSASFAVHCEFDVATAVAGVTRFCTSHRFHAVFAAHVATAASELANNLWLYAFRGGQVRIDWLASAGSTGVELVAEDDGPGIADLAQALREGYSSGGGMGFGLPGVQRLMDEMQVHTAPGRGTRVVARKWQHRPA